MLRSGLAIIYISEINTVGKIRRRKIEAMNLWTKDRFGPIWKTEPETGSGSETHRWSINIAPSTFKVFRF